jgi:hypothetical protein
VSALCLDEHVLAGLLVHGGELHVPPTAVSLVFPNDRETCPKTRCFHEQFVECALKLIAMPEALQDAVVEETVVVYRA